MLFIDLDETLIKSLPNKILPKADFVFQANGSTYSTFLRPDYKKIGNIPFVVFTASLRDYASKVSNFLKTKGLNVQGFLCREHLKPSAPRYPLVTGYLLDNSRLISLAKLRKLPQVKWIHISPFDVDEKGILKIDSKVGNSLPSAIHTTQGKTPSLFGF